MDSCSLLTFAAIPTAFPDASSVGFNVDRDHSVANFRTICGEFECNDQLDCPSRLAHM